MAERRESTEGVFLGDCLKSMQHLHATPYWAELDGASLFLEIFEEKPRLGRAEGILAS